MKNKSIFIAALVLLGFLKPMHQFGERALGALQKGAAGLIFSDADAAALSKAAVDKMD
jgi:putative metalloprotease